MINLYDILYATGLLASAPYWLIQRKTRLKVLRALRERLGQDIVPRLGNNAAVMIHAVSLGEMNATTALVRQLSARNESLRFIISATTDTGIARAHELYGANDRVTVVHFPLDFTPAIASVLRNTRPSLVVLMELEVWPNFMQQCRQLRIPVILINGRLTETSFRNYRIAKPLVKGMFQQLRSVCVQDEVYASRFKELGVLPERVSVTGTMKFDSAQVADRIDGAEALARELSLDAGEPLWVCGSTGPAEEEMVLRVYATLRDDFPTLRLAIIPRHPKRFDEVAAAIVSRKGRTLIRRSAGAAAADASKQAILLGDTMGELRKFYSLATVVFVGRTLVDLGQRQHGSDMIEPAALGKAVVVGPFTGNFADVMRRFRAEKAIVEVPHEQGLYTAQRDLLKNPARAAELGRAAQATVRANQGATSRHADVIQSQLTDARGR